MHFRKRLLYLGPALSLFCLLIIFPGKMHSRPAFASYSTRAEENGNVPVLTYKYDNQRTGANANETILTPDNVKEQSFGQLISYPADGQIYAQPLYVPNVKVGNATRNLVFVVTQRDSAYAFDADSTDGQAAPVWHTSFLNEGAVPVTSQAKKCPNVEPDMGVTSTPVIDRATNTLFLVSYAMQNSAFIYKIHALDLATGQEKTGSPVLLARTGFNSNTERQRAGLLLVKGRIYIAFASFCDHGPYHGWLLSYSYDSSGFHARNAYNATPTGKDGGIWSGGSGIAADEEGNIYAMTGNGTFDLNTGGPDAGDSFLKLTPNLVLIDYFTPFNQTCLNAKDLDLGSGGPLLAPENWLISGGKEGRLYVIDIRHMGHFHNVPNPCAQQAALNLDPIAQELAPNKASAVFSTPVYWHGSRGDFVFVAGIHDHTRAYSFSQGKLAGPISLTPETFTYSGGNPVVSSNGTTPGTGILWTIVAPGYLRAYDATNLNHELYSDQFGSYNKFVPPVVTNGKVFVATQNSLKIYGLLTNKPTPPGK
ncbi:MAG TPA: hypothetical protein VFV38_12165 [Ktedonobacteraceae bacterium]|nr:hypothetical protein [Ktedonobacteraceae bacterium]